MASASRVRATSMIAIRPRTVSTGVGVLVRVAAWPMPEASPGTQLWWQQANVAASQAFTTLAGSQHPSQCRATGHPHLDQEHARQRQAHEVAEQAQIPPARDQRPHDPASQDGCREPPGRAQQTVPGPLPVDQWHTGVGRFIDNRPGSTGGPVSPGLTDGTARLRTRLVRAHRLGSPRSMRNVDRVRRNSASSAATVTSSRTSLAGYISWKDRSPVPSTHPRSAA